MPLNLSDPELIKRMRKKGTSHYLERAIKKGADVQMDSSADSLRRFYKLFRDSGTRKGYPVRSFQYIESLSRHYLSKGDGCLVLVSHGGVDVSGVLFVQCGRKAYQMHVGNDDVSPLGRELRAGYAAHWSALRWCRDNGCELADWGGSMTGFPPRPEDYGYSLYQFKAGFGCSIEYLTGYYDMVFRPGLYRTARLGEARLLPFAYRMRARLNGWFEHTRETGTRVGTPD
jgi:lipid II:glycine glycyltransferase (peptidoglycan interpeptide bridge formation enzyme)